MTVTAFENDKLPVGASSPITVKRWEFNLLVLNAFSLIAALPVVAAFVRPRPTSPGYAAIYFGAGLFIIGLVSSPLQSMTARMRSRTEMTLRQAMEGAFIFGAVGGLLAYFFF